MTDEVEKSLGNPTKFGINSVQWSLYLLYPLRRPCFIRLSAGVIWAVKVLFVFQNPFSCARYFKRINERYSVSLNVTNGIAIAMHFLSARENSIEKKIECFG